MSVQTHIRAKTYLDGSDDRATRTNDLLRKADSAVEPERSELLHQAVTLNLALADSLARRYRARGIDDDDLRQVAYLGLTNAAFRFAPRKGTDFMAFAVPTITGELKRHFRDHAWAVRPPRRVQELRADVSAASAELTQRLSRSPHTRELAEFLEVRPQDVFEVYTSDAGFSTVSLDYRDDEASAPLVDSLAGDDPGFGRVEARITLADACRRLPSRDRRILHLRYFHGSTQQEIGNELGVTQMQVSRLLADIIRRLRQQIGVEDAEPSTGVSRPTAGSHRIDRRPERGA